jgi:acyl carrier protein
MSGNHAGLRSELKQFIVRRLRLDQIDPGSIHDDRPLAQGGLDLDSIDMLELVVGIEKEYGVKIADAAESRRALASVASLAEFVAARRAPV